MRFTRSKNVLHFGIIMVKIASVSGDPPKTTLGELTTLTQTPGREALLAFGHRRFRAWTFLIFSISVSLNFSNICPTNLCTDVRLCVGPLTYFSVVRPLLNAICVQCSFWVLLCAVL